MDATRLPERPEDYVCLQMAKGVWLLLTPQEYKTALFRGKMARRAARRARHEAKRQARQEADTLAWLTKERT